MKKIFFLFYLLPLFLQAQTLTDSLKAYWSFDGNTSDVSGNGHDATVFSATPVPDRLGNANSAYYFNGTTDYMTFTSSAKMQPNLPVSVSVWIMRTTPPPGPAADAILGTEHNTNNGYYSGFWVNIMPNSGAIQINFGDNTGPCGYNYRRTITGYTNVCDGQWHLLTFVVTGATTMQLYIDCQAESGSLSGDGAINPVYSNATTGIIGNFLCGLNGNDGHFTGSIDELRFYRRALSALDVAALYNFPNAITPNVNKCTGIKDIGAPINLQVFPQPTSEILYLAYTLENTQNINVILYDMMGKKVKEIQFAKETGTISHEIPISNLLKGIYNLQILGENSVTMRKVIVE